MDDNKQHAIAELEEEIAGLRVHQERIALLPDGLPGRVWATRWDLKLSLPYDITAFRQVRHMLGADWKHFRGYRANDGGFIVRYRHDSGVELCVYVEGEHIVGDTCKRIQIGEKTIPVYKVVCNGAAMEAA